MFARICASIALAACLWNSASANDWIFDNGPYTRDAKTGERVEQYQKPKTPTLIPYSKYFSPDGPHPYIPYWYYEDALGFPGYGGGYGGYGYGFGGGYGAYGYGFGEPTFGFGSYAGFGYAF